jgi:hypothetical protein
VTGGVAGGSRDRRVAGGGIRLVGRWCKIAGEWHEAGRGWQRVEEGGRRVAEGAKGWQKGGRRVAGGGKWGRCMAGDDRSGNKAAGGRQEWQKGGRREQDVGGRETKEVRRKGGIHTRKYKPQDDGRTRMVCKIRSYVLNT